MGLATRRLNGFGQNAAQDIHFQLGHPAASVQTPQATHQMPWLQRVKKANLHQCLLQVNKIRFQLIRRNRLVTSLDYRFELKRQA
jgi:hypothetical protein